MQNKSNACLKRIPIPSMGFSPSSHSEIANHRCEWEKDGGNRSANESEDVGSSEGVGLSEGQGAAGRMRGKGEMSLRVSPRATSRAPVEQ